MVRRLAPYAAGLAGVVVITAVIGLLRRWLDPPAMTVAYVVLVMYLGARAGRLPALATALLGFLVYEFFFVPPYGSLAISAPRDVLALAVLLAAAAVGELLVSALVARTVGAEAKARESASLYEVALAALRERDAEAALRVLAERAAAEPGVAAMTVLEETSGGLHSLAGPAATPAELSQAAWTVANDVPQGGRLIDNGLQVFEQVPPRPAYFRVAGGVAIIRTDGGRVPPESARVLGALVGIAGLLLDRRRGQEQAARARALEESDRVKANVLSALAHEVKTPLAALRTGLSAMGLDRHLRTDQRAMLEGLEKQTARLDRVVHDVLTMTRLDEGLVGERSPVNLPEVVGSAVSSLGAVLAPFDLRVEVAADLPPVLGDEVQLDRVFVNLLENAAQWTAPGGRIGVGARQVADGIEAWVENEGPSIPPETQAAIFTSYWTGRPDGSGLGLAISRRIVETHGGSIDIRNTRTGPRFIVKLPVAAVAPA